ncbi:hypothetical protein [Carnimonas nigrificans]|uniref:hypothetical protein n=1 Tax=Carnimonas nigrificans TaxID=64323 RepID=UPI000472ED48|nr:hypothetical protein [Carnimonas nigrificans]
MILGADIVGKVVVFICQKVGEKLVGIPFDKRKKACRSLTKLYFCLQSLDDVTQEVLTDINECGDNRSAFSIINSFNNHITEIKLATNMFIDLSYELYEGLKIIDPNLAYCCSSLYMGKMDFLHFMTNCVQWENKGGQHGIVVKLPKGYQQSVDMDKMYHDVERAMKKGEKFYWPISEFDNFSRDYNNVCINWSDQETAEYVLNEIEKQNKLLGKAKKMLRDILKSSFSIEEVLFQNDSHPYR